MLVKLVKEVWTISSVQDTSSPMLVLPGEAQWRCLPQLRVTWSLHAKEYKLATLIFFVARCQNLKSNYNIVKPCGL